MNRDLVPRARAAVASTRHRLRAVRLENRIVWVLGSARSGTTWLASMLAGLTGSTLVDEPLIGAHLAVPVGAVTSLPRGDDPLLLDTGRDRPDYFFSQATEAAWQPALRRLLLERLAASARGGESLIVKEPNGALAAPVLLRTLPSSRLLFVVRDGRDAVDSMVDGASGGWIAENHGVELAAEARRDFIDQRARQWVRTVEAVERAYDAHVSHLRLRVTYERLLADSVGEVERIVHWMGRDDVRTAVPDAVTAYSFENVPSEAKGRGRFARAATPGLWRQNFSDDEQAQLHRIMGPTLARLGYEV